MFSRTTRVFLAVLVAAAAAYFLLERPHQRARERASDAASRLLVFDASAVDGVRIARPDGVLDFAVRATHWEMTAPVADLAEASTVASLLDALYSARVARNLGREDDDEFGLAHPTATVWLAAAGDTVGRVDLGGYTVERDYVYARRDGGDVVLAPTDVLRAATLPVDAYRNRRVVLIDRSVVTGFELRNPRGSSRWSRSDDGGWFTTTAGDTIAGDSVEVEGILRTLRGLRVARILAPSDTTGAMDGADVLVSVENRSPSPPLHVRFRCRAGAPCRARCDHETRVTELSSDLGALANADLERLRDRRLLRFAPENAGRIEVLVGDTTAVLVRSGDGWGLPNPALGPLDPARTADLVRALRALRWTRRATDPAPLGASADTIAVVVYARSGSVLDEIQGRVGGRPPVVLATSRSVGFVTETDARELLAFRRALRGLRR